MQYSPRAFFAVSVEGVSVGGGFSYLNYNTGEFDSVRLTVSSSGFFSGSSVNTGRLVTGQVNATAITVTYGGLTQTIAKESTYGPTRAFAGSYEGYIQEPSTQVDYASIDISSHNEIAVFVQGTRRSLGLGTIDSFGNLSVTMVDGSQLTGRISPSNGKLSGPVTFTPGGQGSFSFTKAIPGRLANIATRGVVGSGQQVLIGGFIIVDGGKTVLITAKGPSLAAAGVSGAVPNPKLDLYSGSQLIASNLNWRSNANASEIAASGIAPTDDREAALQVNLEPGAYTVVVSSEDANTGVGLVEVYGVGNPIGF